MLRLIDLMEPTVKSGSGDAQMLGHFSSGYPKSLDMPEYEQPFSYCVSGFLQVLFDTFLKDGDLSFELVDLVFQKDVFLVFLVNVHGGEAFKASFTNSA